MNKKNYIQPEVEIITLAVEQGFGGSERATMFQSHEDGNSVGEIGYESAI